jgi:quinol monooxygenase YgiN
MSTPPTRIDLHLRCRVLPGKREEFLAFLHEARSFYEAPGGITVRLLTDVNDDHRFIELILYDSINDFNKDQLRVANDPEMKAYLSRWRSLLAEEPTVEVYQLTGF